MRICLCIMSDSSYSHNHTLTHSHTLLITCTCVDLTKGAQDKDFSYSFSILSPYRDKGIESIRAITSCISLSLCITLYLSISLCVSDYSVQEVELWAAEKTCQTCGFCGSGPPETGRIRWTTQELANPCSLDSGGFCLGEGFCDTSW